MKFDSLASIFASSGLLGMVTALAVTTGCAHGKIGIVDQELKVGSISTDRMIYVEPIRIDTATFSGDKAADAVRVSEEKKEIEDRFNRGIAEQLRKRGFNAQAAEAPKSEGLILSGHVTKFEHGSAAARILVGFGAGSSNLFTTFELKDTAKKAVLAKFEIIATSGGNGGFQAAGGYLKAHLEDGAEKTAEYLQKANTGKK